MRTFIANLVAVLVCSHALLGCCWHHGHTCVAGDEEHASLGVVECCEPAHGDDSHEHESPHRDACQESPCVFTTVSGPTYDAALQLTLWQPVCTDGTALVTTLHEAAFDSAADNSPAATIPMRLHLFKGQLLI